MSVCRHVRRHRRCSRSPREPLDAPRPLAARRLPGSRPGNTMPREIAGPVRTASAAVLLNAACFTSATIAERRGGRVHPCLALALWFHSVSSRLCGWTCLCVTQFASIRREVRQHLGEAGLDHRTLAGVGDDPEPARHGSRRARARRPAAGVSPVGPGERVADSEAHRLRPSRCGARHRARPAGPAPTPSRWCRPSSGTAR